MVLALKYSLRMSLKLGRMELKFFIIMLVNMMVLITNLGKLMRLSEIRGKICHMCLIGILRSKKKNTKFTSLLYWCCQNFASTSTLFVVMMSLLQAFFFLVMLDSS